MSRVLKLVFLFILLLTAQTGFAGEDVSVSPMASKLQDFGGGWAITNSMLTGWAL